MQPVSTLIPLVWEQNRLLLVIAISFGLLSLGLGLYQWQVVSDRLLELRVEQTNLQQRLRQTQAGHAESGELLSKAEQMAVEFRQFQTLIPTKEHFSDFLGELFSWAEESQLDIKQINYTPKVDEDSGYLEYGLGFSVNGNYENLKRFVHFLENAQRILVIDRISLSGSEAADQTKPGVQLQIQLTTYFQEEAQ